MTKLTPTQFLVLSSARDRDDGLAIRPLALRAAAAGKLVSSLCNKGFAKEIRAKLDAPVWREDAEGRFALKILKAGRLAAEAEAIGQTATANDEAEEGQVAAETPSSMVPQAAKPSKLDVSRASVAVSAPAVRAGSKRASVVALLQRRTGATMAELIASTGWLPHTTRAALTGLRKSGFVLERFQDEDLAWKYKIAESAEGASADATEKMGGRASARSVSNASVVAAA